MKIISRNLHVFTATIFALALVITASHAYAQDAVRAEKAKAANKAEYKNKSFCSNNSWSSDDKVSFSDLREMTIPSSGSIVVDGRQNGGISVKGEERSDVLVRACVQSWGATDEAAKAVASNIRIGTSGTIKAEGPDVEKGWSVSYQILAPRNSNLNLKAHNGGISVSGIDGTAEFETLNGGLHVSELSGNIKGRTANGGVHVTLAGTSWRGTGLDLQTTNGGVHLTMSRNYAARIETGTVNGGFHSEVPALQVEKTDDGYKHRAKRITADINGGGAPIRLITTNGGVHINTLENE
ncbi:MAG TPA: DUF4097 family beta strand repeat-containing protein [Pyrinomonadaceae bacterium]|nr:DUF4097 family beta strand repeat-containing protein [Pyrinomonadaceae bacterium]